MHRTSALQREESRNSRQGRDYQKQNLNSFRPQHLAHADSIKQ